MVMGDKIRRHRIYKSADLRAYWVLRGFRYPSQIEQQSIQKGRRFMLS
jgi:hypothetical protein